MTVGDRESAWVKVRTGSGDGWVFGGLLSEARTTADLDEDGISEVLVLAYRTDHHEVVRVSEPGSPVTELDLGIYEDIVGPDVEMRLSVTTAAETGVPLARVFWPGREMCGSGTVTKWVSYRGGVPKLALEGRQWADAPVFDHTLVTFHPALRTATSTRTYGNDEEPPHEEVRELRFVDGAFVP